MYRIRVVPDYRWSRAQVSGREFTKDWVEYADGYVNDEIKNSELLEVEEVVLAPVVNATRGAIALASESGIDILAVAGTGEDGRVLKADVEAHLEARLEVEDGVS